MGGLPLDRGIWYRRKTGGMHSARRVANQEGSHPFATFHQIEVTPLNPNDLNPDGRPFRLHDEDFYCFYCRKEGLR